MDPQPVETNTLEPQSRRVPGADGLDLHVLDWSREGVPLLLLHGFGNEAHIWDDFAPAVAPYYRTLAMDHRGHGDSAWDPDGRYDLDTMVRDVEAVTASLDIDRLVVIGHSLGGRVATLFAGRHPERMAGLILIDIGPEVDPRGSMRIVQDVTSNQKPTFASVEEFASGLSLAYPEAQPQALMRMARHGVRQRDDGLYELKMDPALRGAMTGGTTTAGSLDEQAVHGQDAEAAQWDALGRIPCQTLVIRGAASDILSPETADRMVDDVLSNGTLAIIGRAGHSVMTDNPEGFEEAVSGFLLSDG